jgi:hypothetical protein
VNESVANEIQANMARAQPGTSVVWLNGKVVSETDMNPLSCVLLILDYSGYLSVPTLLISA